MDIKKFYLGENEQPLDVIKPDGGMAGIFRTIACVGDSLASGELESFTPEGQKGYHDYYDISWGQYMARALGAKVYNFSRGGMTAQEYLNGWGDANDVFHPDKAAQAYIIALGCNDMVNQRMEGGSAFTDIDRDNPDNNKPTFAGFMGKIIQKYREIQPKARIFLLTMPREEEIPASAGEFQRMRHREIIYELAAFFDYTYVIDLWEYGPMQDEEFRRHFYLGGHLNASGYLLTAQMIMSYMDYLIRKYPDDFAQAGFIGTGHYNSLRKW